MAIKTITVEQLKEKLAQKEKIILIDCREPYEWEQIHLPKSILIPTTKIGSEYKKAGNPKSELLVYSNTGTRSVKACFEFLQQGYENISHLKGGLEKWVNNGGEIIRIKK